MITTYGEVRAFEHPDERWMRWQPVVRYSNGPRYYYVDSGLVAPRWSTNSFLKPKLYRSRERARRVAVREAKRRDPSDRKNVSWTPVQ